MAKWQSQDSNPSPVHCYPGPCSVLAHMQLSCVEHQNHLESLVTHPLPCMEQLSGVSHPTLSTGEDSRKAAGRKGGRS